MFTGIIKENGFIREIRVSRGRKTSLVGVTIPKKLARELKKGDSVAVNGVCLTLLRKSRTAAYFNVVTETLKRTTLGGLKRGERVHLELPLKKGSRLHGHFVQGHVDGVGRLRRIRSLGREKSFLVSFPANLAPFILEKGSVAMDGVSLTVGKVRGGSFWVHVIPHTLKHTRFGMLRPGARVNLEADVLAKLVARLFCR